MILLAALVVAVAAVLAAPVGRLVSVTTWRTRRRVQVVLTLKSGRSFRGVLWSVDGEAVVLRNAEALVVDSAPIPVDGEVIVLRGDIEFFQRP